MRKIEKIMPTKEGWPKKKVVIWAVLGVVLAGALAVGGVVVVKQVVRYQEEAARLEEERLEAERIAREEEERIRAEEEARKAKEEAEKRHQERLKTEKLVALTFDDGPSAETTNRLLDILKEKGVKATFFVLGNMAKRAPEVVRRELEEGHEVGSHTTAHVNLNKVKSAAEVRNEMAEMQGIFEDITGKGFEIMRPPYGNGIRRAVVTENVGVPMIHWSVDTLDWKSKDAAAVRAAAMGAVYDGAIVLMHDIYGSTVDAAEMIIDDLLEEGYELATVSELAGARGVKMVAGQTYFYFKP